MQHHERLDGCGYPLGVTADKIHKFAKIIAIADIYDAMAVSYTHLIWGYDYDGDGRAVDATIKRLRQKIAHPDYNYIHTIRGFGYKFEVHHD